MGVLRAAGILAVAGGLSLLWHPTIFISDGIHSILNARHSTRQTLGQKQDLAGGFDYEYATNWSFSLK